MKQIIILCLLVILSATLNAQQVGSKVTFPATDGKTYTGVIKEIQADKFKIKYDGFEFESWLTANQFTVIDNNQTAGNQPGLPQTVQETIPQTTPQTIPSTLPQSVATNANGQGSMTHSDSLKLALNNMKTAVGAFKNLFNSKRDTMSIMVSDIDYDNPNLSQLKDNLKTVKGVKSVTMHYKSGTAILEIYYKGKAMDVWDNLPASAKSSFKLLEAGDNNIILKQRNTQ